MSTITNHPNPLQGVRVLDLSRVLAGPWCTQILGDFGADVSKIEMPGVGDDTRTWGPPFLDKTDGDGPGESAYYLGCNRNKRSVALDMSTPEGAALVRNLAREADVLVENFRVGGLKKFGLDYESLRELNPRLVYCSITGFGQNGPYADRGGYDYVAQAMGGLMSITGEKDGESMKVGVAITDLSTGIYATISVLMALRHAEATGVGQHIDCSLLDTQMTMLANQAMSWLVGGIIPGRLGNAHPTVVPYRVFQTADDPLVVAVGNDGQFQAMCKAIKRPDLASDPRYILNASRVTHRATLEDELQNTFTRRDRAALMELLVTAKVPAGPVNSIDRVFQDPFAEARKVVHCFTRDNKTSVPTLAFPGKLSVTPPDYRLPPPKLGEHTFDVLRDWLQLTPDDLERLVNCQVIAGRDG